MKLSLVVIVANGGCADEIMEVIKLDGARGGTIIMVIVVFLQMLKSFMVFLFIRKGLYFGYR